MEAPKQVIFPNLPHQASRFIKSLHLKKYRQQEKAFVVEGAKNVLSLLDSHYTVQMVVGTPPFLHTHVMLKKRNLSIFQADEATLTALGTFVTNKTALAVAHIPPHTSLTPPRDAWGLVLDDIRDPGNLGTIVRIADWYNIPALVCSPSTVDLYNSKVLQASMGSFTRVRVHYAPLPAFLNSTSWPIMGAFTTGENLHHTPLQHPAWIVIGNESSGISPEILPYIQKRISVPRYGQAESLNAAMATAIVCDNWRRQQQTKNYNALAESM